MFQLPEGADEDKIHAEMKNGILTIQVAKKAGFIENIKQIAIQ
jgi:HSP20 family protein